jgi:hypothetical protein
VEITFDPRKSERNVRERNLGFEQAKEFDFASASYFSEVRQTKALGCRGLFAQAAAHPLFSAQGGRDTSHKFPQSERSGGAQIWQSQDH